MKLKTLLIGFILMLSMLSIAQDIEYTYDAAGNRITRRIIPPTPPESYGVDNNTEEYIDLLGEKQLKIYPNPTRGKLAIELVNYAPEESNGTIQVFDMNGRLVLQKAFLDIRTEIDISKEPQGNYLLIFTVGTEKSEWKIIKQ